MEAFPKAIVLGVQPRGCDILNEKFSPHKLQGIGVIKSKFLATEIIDDMYTANYNEAIFWMNYIAREMGVLVGISSGVNIAASMYLAEKLGEGKNIVTIAPDSGISYINLFDSTSNAQKEEFLQ